MVGRNEMPILLAVPYRAERAFVQITEFSESPTFRIGRAAGIKSAFGAYPCLSTEKLAAARFWAGLGAGFIQQVEIFEQHRFTIRQ